MESFLWAMSASLIWGVVPLFEKLGLIKTPIFAGLFYRCIGVVIGLIPLSVYVMAKAQLPLVSVRSAVFLAASGLGASFLAQIAFYRALAHGDISRVVPLAGTYPLISFVLGVVLLHEGFSIPKLIGVVLIIAGIWLLK